MVSVPFESSVIDEFAVRSSWDDAAPAIVAEVLRRWELTPGAPFAGGEAGTVLSVRQADGAPAVLKVGYPHVESVWEAVALEVWAPLAPRVLRQDAEAWAMLLEPVVPGTPLSRSPLPPGETVAIGAALWAELAAMTVPDRIPSLREHIAHFGGIAQAQLPGWRALLNDLGHRELVERGIAELPDLADADSTAFLHGDFNPGNVLAAADGTWRVIDPSPMTGDPAFDLWPLVEQLGSPWEQQHPGELILSSMTLATEVAGVGIRRALRWAASRAALNVTWYLEDEALDLARGEVAKLVVLDDLLKR